MTLRAQREGGFTLLESLVLLLILAIAIMVGVAMVQERLYIARARVTAQQLAVALRSARFTAVSTRRAVDVVISIHPTNTYAYTDARGKLQTVRLPLGVRIASSTSPVHFLPNGTVPGGSSTTIEIDLKGSRTERWTISTQTLGVPHLIQERTDS